MGESEKKEQKDMQGALFINNRKEKPEQPNFTGRCLIDGKLYYVSGWGKYSQNGEKYISLSFNEPQSAQKQEEASKAITDSF